MPIQKAQRLCPTDGDSEGVEDVALRRHHLKLLRLGAICREPRCRSRSTRYASRWKNCSGNCSNCETTSRLVHRAAGGASLSALEVQAGPTALVPTVLAADHSKDL